MNAHTIRLLGAVGALACCAGCDRAASVTARPADSVAPAVAELHVSASPVEMPPPRAVPVYSRNVAPLLDRYCLGCHDRAAAEGGVILDAFDDGPPTAASAPLLLRIASVLRSGDMPPEEEPAPGADERETLEAWLDAVLVARDRGEGASG